MTTPTPYGQDPTQQAPEYAYGSGQPQYGAAGGYPYGDGSSGAAPQKSGGAIWAWIVIAVLGIVLLCGGGLFGLGVIAEASDPSSTQSQSEEDESSTDEETSPTDEETSPTDEETSPTDEETSPTEEETSPTDDTPTQPTTTDGSVPPTPAGSTKNTDPKYTISTSELEQKIATQKGISASEVDCDVELTYIEGRTVACDAPARDGSGTSAVYAKVAWAVIDDGRIRAWLTFKQYS